MVIQLDPVALQAMRAPRPADAPVSRTPRDSPERDGNSP